MIRNLLASAIILTASASAFAGIADDLKVEGAVSADVVNTALSACADADCKADVLAEAIEAGIDATSVMSIALASGIESQAISSALLKAGVTQQEILVAGNANGLTPADLTPATAGGNTQPPAAVQQDKKIATGDVPAGSEPLSISAAQ